MSTAAYLSTFVAGLVAGFGFGFLGGIVAGSRAALARLHRKAVARIGGDK